MSEEVDDTPLSVAEDPLLPVRMLNEFVYCPRLAYLEWVQGEFADSADTVEGRFHHRRVDEAPQRHVSRLMMRMRKRVQLCAQGLILRDNGFECDGGILYFVGSRERVAIAFDPELIERTLALIAEMRRMARENRVPPPLVDSPKCPRCSLVGICLPDEVGWPQTGGEQEATAIRRLLPAHDDALPLYVQQAGARVTKDGDCLKVWDHDAVLAEARLVETSHLVLFGAIQVSTQVVQELCKREIPISYLSSGGWFYGLTTGLIHKNVELRRRQYAAAADQSFCLRLASRLVQAKIANCRTLLRRNHVATPETVLQDLKRDLQHAGRAQSLEELLGIEGTAGRRYFAEFRGMLKTDGAVPEFDFDGRNRRPPKGPAMRFSLWRMQC